MRQVFLFVVLVGAVLILLGFLALGAFPPPAHVEQVRHAIPADKVAVH